VDPERGSTRGRLSALAGDAVAEDARVLRFTDGESSAVRFLFDDFEGLLRTLVVGVLAYVALIVVLRSSGKRTLSKMNAFDLVVTVALGSTLATILLSRDTPLADGVVAFLVLAGMQRLITEVSLRSPFVARLVKAEPRALLYRGKVLQDALREERVLEEELQAALRAQGFARYEDTDLVVLETDGSFTAVSSLPEGPSAATDGVRGLPSRR
jgi:uncharacterized membrane protein YcaP (DUF421 family)